MTSLRLLAPLRHRPYALLWTGQTISRLGDAAYSTVLTWTAYALTGSTAATGVVLTARGIPPLLLLLFGGIIGDRASRRGIILISDGLSAVAVGAVALRSFLHDLTVTALVVLAAFFGVVESIFGPAYQALIPEVVPEDRLPAANALQMLSQSTSSIAGAAIGAWLYSWGRAGTAFAFDALNFVVSAFASALLRVPDRTVAVCVR
jgi:DHA3 family tetracycline resistance protein-like MFS transporter